ncbi:MAG: membrane protein insertion efficiency factor YidD [Sulfurovum sp.]|nr:membrane protein insertion efficiency factor YidD [Sulfurovum sp.]
MNKTDFFLAPIKGYQYISKMLPASCRYYPSCSEYASWQFEFTTPHKALTQSTLRILRCNPFFKGGIDYPLVDYSPRKHLSILKFNIFCGKIDVLYWLIPQSMSADNSKYYILKDFDAINRST